MARIIVTTTQEERDRVVAALHKNKADTIAVSAIAELAGLEYSRARYALLDLIEEGTVAKIPVKSFNKHYVRYTYAILDKKEK